MPDTLEKKMIDLLSHFQGKLPMDEYKDNHYLITHREGGVALENLCQQLFEHTIPVEPILLETIKSLANEMKLPPKAWEFLAT